MIGSMSIRTKIFCPVRAYGLACCLPRRKAPVSKTNNERVAESLLNPEGVGYKTSSWVGTIISCEYY